MSSERLLPVEANSEIGGTSPSEMPPKSRIRKIFLLIVGLCSGLFFIIYMVRIQPEFNQYSILKSYNRGIKRTDKDRGPRTILLWNSFFGDVRWSLPDDILGPDYFRDMQCPVTNCELTNNRNFLPSVDMFDAVVFHVAEPFSLLHPVPKRRSPDQHYVFALMEPPGETKHMLGDEGGFYNWTMTYRLDSDIRWPYMYFTDVESGVIVAPALNPTWRKVPTVFDDDEMSKLAETKTKFAAWFVSHCDTLSRREVLTKRLQEFVQVDVFGACGPMKCPHNSDKCDHMLDTEYKFYLAFENSLCLDYVTEKFFNALKRQIVPVVFGGADYTRIAPPYSYINAEDFKNVKDLAEYLIYLNDNPKEYARYFWWRKHYRITNIPPFCDLCAKLNSPAAEKKVQFYSDIENWWLGESCYFEPKISL